MLSGHRQRAYLAAKRRRAEYQWLDEAIERLVACAVIIQFKPAIKNTSGISSEAAFTL
jgi:hypothetical protein